MAATTYAGAWGAAVTVPSGVTIDVTTNGGGPTTVAVTPETYDSPVALLAELIAQLDSQRPVTAGSWSASSLVTAGASPTLTLAVSAGTFSITWTSTLLRDILGFTGNISSVASATGTNAVRGIWQPDCPLWAQSRHRQAPRVTDARQARTPTGKVYTDIGNSRYEHKQLRYSHLPSNKTWRTDEVVTNESLQQWLDDTQFGAGHAWFDVGSKCQIYASDGYRVGESDSIMNWWINGVTSIEDFVTRVDEWDGRWSATFPGLTSDGL